MRSSRLALPLLLVLGASVAAEAKLFLGRKQALAQAFPDADRVETRNLVLDDERARAVEKLARRRLDSRLVTVYTGVKEERVLGYAFIDIHVVRTLPGAFLVVLSPDGAVRSLRVLAFHEPLEYLPSERWLAQFDDERLDDDLQLRGRIHGIAGSTLSARTVTGSVRRALALYQVLLAGGSEASPEAPDAVAADPDGS